jgi:hypothetical protein
MTDSTRTDDPARDLLPGLHEALRREDRGWRRLRSWSTTRRECAFLALLLVVAIAVLALTPRSDLEAVPYLRLGLGIGVTMAAAAFGTRVFLRPMQRRRPKEAVAILSGLVLLLVPLLFALLPPAHDAVHAHPESFAGTGADFVPRALACLVFGSVAGAPLVAFLLLSDRRPPAALVRAAVAAGAGGAVGTLGLLFHCPLVSTSHRMAGHGAVALALALLLAAVLLAVRKASSGSPAGKSAIGP